VTSNPSPIFFLSHPFETFLATSLASYSNPVLPAVLLSYFYRSIAFSLTANGSYFYTNADKLVTPIVGPDEAVTGKSAWRPNTMSETPSEQRPVAT